MEENESDNITRLDYFFDMLDAVEEDISQLVSDENEEATKAARRRESQEHVQGKSSSSMRSPHRLLLDSATLGELARR